jgi:hypothetical protein
MGKKEATGRPERNQEMSGSVVVEDYDRWRNPTSRPVITFMLSG